MLLYLYMVRLGPTIVGKARGIIFIIIISMGNDRNK